MILKNMGPKWFFHRILHSVKLKIRYYNFIEKKYNNIESELDVNATLKNLQRFKNENLIDVNNLNEITDEKKKEIIRKADDVISNKFEYFFTDVFQFDEINWHLNPYNGKVQDANTKWYEIPMHKKENGDIKDYWELSRFVYTYNLINAYQITQDDKYVQKFIDLALNWIANNKFEYGVNYKCSQEASIRCINWLMGILHLDIIENHPEQAKKIIVNIFKQSHHVKELMPYSVNCVKNNHTLNEALFLYIIGSYFDFSKSNAFYKEGKRVYNSAIKEQILSDGSYIQNSHTYHRVMLLSGTMFKYFEKKEKDLNTKSTKLVVKATEFLTSFIMENGDVPNYGSNDGSVPFDLLSSNYRNFKICIDIASKVFTGEQVYFDDENHVNAWFSKREVNIINNDLISPSIKTDSVHYDKGGYIIFKENDKKVFIRVKDGKRRPGQSDNNTIDFWSDNDNLIMDTGTYKYTTSNQIIDYFKGTVGHNFLRINEQEPMKRISQFMYANWSTSTIEDLDLQNRNLKIKNLDYKNFDVNRSIQLNNSLNILDSIESKKNEDFGVEFFFHFKSMPTLLNQDNNNLTFVFSNNHKIELSSNESIDYNIFFGSENPFLGWKSDYYNKLEKTPQLIVTIKSNRKIHLETKYIIQKR